MKTLIIDNYDSFTYNLYQYVAELGGNPIVFRNDEISIEDIKKSRPTHIIISPGPGTPEKKTDIGICIDVIKEFSGRVPILGVCLGHQAIGYAFGGEIARAPEIMHGKESEVVLHTTQRPHRSLFENMPRVTSVMRYHSLIIERKTLPQDFDIVAETKNGLIMAIQHKKFPLYGIQFHPESIGTPLGKDILNNFLHVA